MVVLAGARHLLKAAGEPHFEQPTLGQLLEVARPAPRRAKRLAFGTWMALARASAEPSLDEGAQGLL